MTILSIDTALDIAADTVSGSLLPRDSNLIIVIKHNLTTASGTVYVDVYPELSLDGTTWNQLTTPTVRINTTGAGSKMMQLSNLPIGTLVRLATKKTLSPVGNITQIQVGY
jgi:hypothetical protein